MSDQLSIDFAAPAARRGDIDTAKRAAVIALHGARNNRALALIALLEAGPDGLTDFELAAVTGVKQSSIGCRRLELQRLGLVEPLVVACEPDKRAPLGVRPLTRPSDSGAPAQVWVISDAGCEYCFSHGVTGAAGAA